MSNTSRGGWVRVTQQEPCRFCELGDERCAVSQDGRRAVCYRNGDGAAREKTDSNGSTYWVHQLEPDPRADGHGSHGHAPGRSRPNRERADPDTLHRVYSALLSCGNTTLSEANREGLARRGFPLEEAERRQYRSRPERDLWRVAHGLADAFGEARLLAVPGFYRNGHGTLTLAGKPGLLLPVRDPAGRVVGLMNAPDARGDPGTPKYFWLSSAGARKGHGPSPGAPIHVPLGIGRPARVVRVTEGVLKADLAQVLCGLPTIGTPGVGNWRGVPAVLEALGAETARVAYDADWKDNAKVARALLGLLRALSSAGLTVEVEMWDGSDGKGIDDLLAGGKTPEVVAGFELEALLHDLGEAVGGTSGAAKSAASGGGEGEKESQSEILLRLASIASLFHTDDGKTFATIPVGGHAENHPIKSTSFRRWLIRAFYQEQARPPSGEALQAVLNVLEAKAHFDGPAEAVFTRVAALGDPADPDDPVYYLDLGDLDWRAVRVGRDGWRVDAHPPVKFRRAKGMLPLPAPEPGGSVEALRPFLNVASEDDWRLMVASLTAALRPGGPYPIWALQGEQGSAKSTTTRVARMTIDPHVTPLRCEPKEVRDLMIAATNAWCVTLDNLSSLPPWLSDALCRLATGGGFGTRTLYENDEETFFDAMRPVLLNGIEEVATRFDLVDRCLIFQLPAIPEESRREEGPFWREFQAAHPKILGALLDAVAGGLRELPNVRLERLPRMADFASFSEAVGRALGWPAGAFLAAYEANRSAANEQAVEGSHVALAVRELMGQSPTWEGTSGDLLARLGEIAGEATTRRKEWPKSPRGMRGALQRVVPALRKLGIDVEFRREPGGKRRRVITIVFPQPQKAGAGPSPPSPSSPVAGTLEVTPLDINQLDRTNIRDGLRDGADGDGGDRPTDRPAPVVGPNSKESHQIAGGDGMPRDGGDDRDGRAPLLVAEPELWEGEEL